MKLSYRSILKNHNFSAKKFITRLSLTFFLSIFILLTGCDRNKANEKNRINTSNQEMAMPPTMNMEKNSTQKRTVAILIYPGVELLDFTGPTEVFSNARGFEVFTVSATEKNISTKYNTLHLTADYTLSDAPQPDILVLPGAPIQVVDSVGNDKLMQWIKKVDKKTTLNMSVCTGALLLSKAGLLDGKTATSHLSAIDNLQKMNGKVNFVHNARFVEDGKIITTAGVSAGIDGALHVVEKLDGLKAALLVTSIMEYDYWNPEDGLIVDQQPEGQQAEKVQHITGSTLTGETKDPVCGMTVSAGNSKYHTTFKGEEYHFCSASCKKLFDAHSQLYAEK